MNATGGCPKCHGTGMWRYDEWHTQPCPDCCQHNAGVWWLTPEYYNTDKRWCCLAGCGMKWAGIIDYRNARKALVR